MGCLGRKWGAFRCCRVKGVLGSVKGCQRHNGVFGAQMKCWPWGERGVWWMKRGVCGEKGVWGRKAVFGGVKVCLGYIYFLLTNVPESPV